LQELLGSRKKQTLAEIISGEAANCLPRGMEFVLYSQGAVAKPSRTPHFEFNLNEGSQMSYHFSFDPASKPSHWFVLDISIGGEYWLPLVGPPAAEVFAPLPPGLALDAVEDSLGGTPITKRSSTTVY
jgi:hypothetical protein